MSKRWSSEEDILLKELWGQVEAKTIALKLDRTVNAVIIRAKRKKLGSPYYINNLTANALSEIIGIDRHTVINWTKDKNFKMRKKAYRNRKFYCINIDDLMSWLKKNQDKWDTRKIELFALGSEPDWLKEKRLRDKEIPTRKFMKWNDEEDRRALDMYHNNFSYEQIASNLNRSPQSVRSRLLRYLVRRTNDI